MFPPGSPRGRARPGVLRALVVVGLGIALGMAAGFWTYQALSPRGALANPPVDLAAGQVYGIVAGGILGLLVSYAALGVRWVRNAARGALGLVAGALSGLVVYLAGFLVFHRPATGDIDGYILLAAQAVGAVSLWELVAVLVGALVGVTFARHSWRFEGLLAFVSLATVVTGYVAYSLLVTLPQVPSSSLPLSIILFVSETAALALVLVYAFYPLDVAQRKRWRRRGRERAFSPQFRPKVALHVPVYNEPPDLVIATLASIELLDYPRDRFVVMVLDDSTDPQCAAPVERYCAQRGIRYIHRADRRGYKAGALNVALEQTPPDADLVAVVDADYQVEPSYLSETVGYFVDPDLAFVQTPQDYRNAGSSFLTEQYYYADAYFYHTVLPSRNEGNTIIFCGTMGIIRKSVLREVGGWSETHVTEDSELAVRVLAHGYDTLYVRRTYGRGLIPETFDAYRRQHGRWAFGGAQVLRTHWRDFFLSSRLSRRQKFDYVAGTVHWFDGIFLVAIALILLAIGVGDLLGAEVVTHHQMEIWLVGLVPLFLLAEGIMRVRLSLARLFRLSLWGTLRVFGMWFSVKFNNTHAALRGLSGQRMAFARTPKGNTAAVGRLAALRRAAKTTRFETTLTLALALVAIAFAWRTSLVWRAGDGVELARLFFSLWLGLYALVFFSAPLYAYRSYTARPPSRSLARQVPPAALVASRESALPEPPPAPPPPRPRRPPWATASILLVAVLALALRLKDPLSSPVIGAEDPYLHMERTWDLVQGKGLPADYPPGFAVLLAPLALLGPDVFYWAARLGPPLLGVVEVVGVYLLCRHALSDFAALSGAFATAVMPENIVRTQLLFPTALDLALLPFLLLMLLRASDGERGAARYAIAIGALLLLVHPWAIVLALPPVALWLALSAPHGRRRRFVVGALVAGSVAAFVLVSLPGTWNPFPRVAANLAESVARAVEHPRTLWHLPQYVNYVEMLTLPLIVTSILGAGVAIWCRGRLELLGLVWTLPIFLITVEDWFHIWYLPHRTVAYLTLGVALLTAVLVDVLARALPSARPVRVTALGAAGLALVVLTLPAAAATPTWYRLYDEQDYVAWRTVAGEDPSIVVAGSWQARAGYRALTAGEAVFTEEFFRDAASRDELLSQYPDLVVLVDDHTREAGLPTGFLDAWTPVVIQSDVEAYRHESTPR